MMNIILYQPDIPQNVGAMMRLAACMNTPVHVIEPCGFPLDERRIKRVGMDYIEYVERYYHLDWGAFKEWHNKQHNRQCNKSRIVLLTTHSSLKYTDFTFLAGDMLMVGKESAGVPQEVHQEIEHKVTIPMSLGRRSLNVATAMAMVLGEGLRQVGQFK